ncbi:MAG: SIMPL domain-containing protein [Clostridiales bacterium]|nr:SIMPL domain-containing protein [Clostridiales bacterium]
MDEQRLITVTGTATEKLPANFVVISVSAVGESGVYEQAVTAAEQLSDGAVAELKSAGVDVRAAGVSVNVVSEDKKIVGYRAVKKFSAEFIYDKAVLSKALDALSKSKCEWRVSFSLKNADMQEKLITRAVKEAKASAQTIAAAAGVKLGALVKADYASSGGHMPMRMSLSAANVTEPEEITLSETVTCSWEIK